MRKKGVVSFVRFNVNKRTCFHIYYRYFTPFSNELDNWKKKTKPQKPEEKKYNNTSTNDGYIDIKRK